MHWILHYYK